MKKISKNLAVILGVKITKLNVDKTLENIESFLHSSKSNIIFTPNPEICLKASKSKKYAKALNSSHLNVADGFGLKIGGAILGQKIPHRIAGVDLTFEILKKCENLNVNKIYIVSRDDSLAKPKDLNEFFKKNFPKLHCKIGITTQNDYFMDTDLLQDIHNYQPQVIFAAIGAPMQEYWIDENAAKMESARLLIGVGGSFDFLCGKIKRAPKRMRKIGLEWLYRLIQEPKRIKRIINALIIFPLTCVRWRLAWKFKYRKNVCNIIYNRRGEILLIFNPRFYYWTLPQGGINHDEFKKAGTREIKEELGVSEEKITFLQTLPTAYKYEWPKWAKLKQPFKGQKQKFILWKFIGNENDFDFSESDEVSRIKWVKKENLIKEIAPIRRASVEKIKNYL